MKIVFLALLLLNLVFLGWHFWRAPPEPAAAPTVDDGAHSSAVVAATGVKRVKPDSAAISDPVCAAFGPFADRADAEAAVATPRQQGRQFQITLKDITVVDSYRVYFPPYPSSDGAREMAGQLHGAGINDVYIIPAGARKNAVSVGVFNDRSGAERRRQHLRTLGFKPRVEATRKHKESRYWIRARQHSAAAALRRLVAKYAGEKRLVDCP